MKIAFFTEGGYNGKVPRNHPNMRTDLAWICALNADHYNLIQTPNQQYDLAIIITPKNNPQDVDVGRIRNYCKKVAIMQEGPFWLFQDYTVENQIYYYNNLMEVDIIYVHNEQDRKYYKGLTNHSDIRILQSLMIDDSVGEIHTTNRSGVMIGGNMVSWYGGFDSFILASSVTDEVYSPKMGRAKPFESELGINQLPYLQWRDWITELSKRKLGIHMMRTHAAGTFALNCAYLGIPCVGYNGLDTQRILHPNLSVDDGDLETARILVDKLWNDIDFYDKNCKLSYELYQKNFSEDVFKKRFYK